MRDGEGVGRVQRDGGLRGHGDGAGVGRRRPAHVQRDQLQRVARAVLVLSDLLRRPHLVRLWVGVGVR